MGTKSSTKGQEGRYASYKASKTWESNRRLKLQRALKRNPENEQIKIALKDIHYRRKTPTTPVWNHTQRRIAQLFKEVDGSFNFEVFHKNEKTATAALNAVGRGAKRADKVDQGTMFNLGTQWQAKVAASV